MKIVQALWFNKNKDKVDFQAGWLDIRYHLMSWALSSILLRRQNKSLELITDHIGFDLLINQLSLPYTTAGLDLEHFENPIADQFWALKKIYAYSIHEEPFLFVDGDAFCFNSFQLNNENLLAQNYENQFSFYYPVQEAIKQTCNISNSYLDNVQLNAINTGIIGGQDFKFFSSFKNEIFDFAINNEFALHEIVNKCHIEAKYVNVWLEQYCLYNFAIYRNKQISFYIKDKIIVEDDYRYLADFTHLPSSQTFLHIMHLAKMNPTVCEQLAQRLYLESPEMYERVEDISRRLKSTHHFMQNLTPYHQPFARTTYLLKEIINSNEFIDGLESEYAKLHIQINSINNLNYKAILEDVLMYEKAILDFRNNLPDVTFLKLKWAKYSFEVNTFLLTAQVNYETRVLKRSDFCIIVETEWNWAEQNEYAGQLYNRGLSENLAIPASYFAVVLYIYVHENIIREHLLDAINILIIDALEEPKSIDSIVNTVSYQVSTYQPELNKLQLTDLIINRIRHFLYHGIFEIVNN